jgi:hypothetical protein
MQLPNREVRVTYEFFTDDLQNDQYVDAMSSLVELHMYARQGEVMPSYADILAMLQSHKPGIMKRVLRYVKFYDQDEVHRYVPMMIAALKGFGVDWPELNVVSKSLRSDIKESDMSSSELDDFFNIERSFNSNQIYSALLLIDKNDFTATRYPDIAAILDDQQDNIQEFMLHRLDRKDVFEVIRIFDIVQSTKIGWTWPKQFVEQYKHDIVKLLLIAVINPYGDSELALDLAWMLKKNGVTWPELSIIEKSVRTDIKKHEA